MVCWTNPLHRRAGPCRTHGVRNTTPGFECVYPLGRILSGMWLIEIYQTDGRVLVLYEFDNKVRRIYTDGRGHIDTFPSLMGRSIGRWEGDTLVVETANLESGYRSLPGFALFE